MVMKMPVVGRMLISLPSNTNSSRRFRSASWMHFTCDDTTESTSTVIRLNSSKHPHAPHCTSPLKMLPMAL